MREDVHRRISSCARCTKTPPLPYATLFQVQFIPKWGQHIVNYLQNKQFPKKMNKRLRKSIEIEAMDFTLIGTQLYKCKKDHQLRLCINKKEYLSILAQAHANIVGGHFSTDTTAKAILMPKIWWPTLFHNNATMYVKSCDKC